MLESMAPGVTALRLVYLSERDIDEYCDRAAGRAEDLAKQALLNLAKRERGARSFSDHSMMRSRKGIWACRRAADALRARATFGGPFSAEHLLPHLPELLSILNTERI